MKRKIWIPLALVLACGGAVTGYAYMTARHVALDEPAVGSSAAGTSAQATADAWLEQDVSVPAGTEVSAVLQSSLNTKSTRVGDGFTARVDQPVTIGGSVAIPAGALLHGHVALAEAPARTSGRERMQLAFDVVSFGGRVYTLDAQGPVYVGRTGPPGVRNGAPLAQGGADGVGGVLGGVVGGTAGGAAKGALVGGATGTPASLTTRGPHVELPAGRTVRFTLNRDVDVTPARAEA